MFKVSVVDEDIDPGDIWSVKWTVSIPPRPAADNGLVRNRRRGPLDPRKKLGDNFNSWALIDACQPFDWRKELPPVA